VQGLLPAEESSSDHPYAEWSDPNYQNFSPYGDPHYHYNTDDHHHDLNPYTLSHDHSPSSENGETGSNQENSSSLSQPPSISIEVDHREIRPTMEVDTKARAHDLEKGFDHLRASYPEGNIYAIVKGQSIDHIIDLTVLPGGTMVSITPQHRNRSGARIVKVEDVEKVALRKNKRTQPAVRIPSAW
jgi:hypothetical protein